MNKEKIKNTIFKIQETIQQLDNALEQLRYDYLKENNKTGYERVCNEKEYYWINYIGKICDEVEHNLPSDNLAWNNVNYYNDENFAKMQARADILWRKIRRWQALNDEPIDIHSCDSKKYYIYYNIMRKILAVGWCSYTKGAEIYFSSKERAEECIEEFKDELLWYFTTYNPRMDMED